MLAPSQEFMIDYRQKYLFAPPFQQSQFSYTYYSNFQVENHIMKYLDITAGIADNSQESFNMRS